MIALFVIITVVLVIASMVLMIAVAETIGKGSIHDHGA